MFVCKFYFCNYSINSPCLVSAGVGPHVMTEPVYDDGGRHADVEAVHGGVHRPAGGDEDSLWDGRLQLGGDTATLTAQHCKHYYCILDNLDNLDKLKKLGKLDKVGGQRIQERKA